MALLPAPLLAGTSTMQLSGWQVPWMGNATGSSRACACYRCLFAVHAQQGCVLGAALVIWCEKGVHCFVSRGQQTGPMAGGQRQGTVLCQQQLCVVQSTAAPLLTCHPRFPVQLPSMSHVLSASPLCMLELVSEFRLLAGGACVVPYHPGQSSVCVFELYRVCSQSCDRAGSQATGLQFEGTDMLPCPAGMSAGCASFCC